MEKSLISIGTELTCLKGIFDSNTNWNGWVRWPFHPGYSAAARVIAVGDQVTRFKVNDRVVGGSSHNQYFIEDESLLSPVPDSISDENATWVALMRVAQNIVRKCQISMGDNVVVIGQGQVGQLVTQFVRLVGASAIIAVDPMEHRAQYSRQSGATHVLTCTGDRAVEPVREITCGRMADVVIDSTGHPKVLAQACMLCRQYGKLGLVGDCSVPSQQALGPGVVSNSLTILGMHGSCVAKEDNPFYPWTMERTNRLSLEYMAQKRLDPSHLITHTFTPVEAPEVYRNMLDDRSPYLGVIFDWTRL